MAQIDSELWLVRTEDNKILGPFSKTQVQEMISSGKMSLQDEVCAANGFWITLHERNEIYNQFGLDVPREAVSSEEDITQTETVMPSSSEGVEAHSDLSDSNQGTSVLSLGHFRENSAGQISLPKSSSFVPVGEVRGVPKKSLWNSKWFSWVLGIGLVIVGLSLLFLTKT